MANISYTLSPRLLTSLQKIDSLKQDVLLTVLTPKDELFFRWQALCERIFWTFSFSDTPLEKHQIVKLLSESSKKNFTPAERNILAYKRGLNFITREWLGAQKPVHVKTVLELHRLSSPGSLRVSLDSLRACLSYFQDSNEHPVIQAGLIHFLILDLSPFTDGNAILSRLMTYLFFYKEGYDCRGLLVLDEYFRRNLSDYQKNFKQAQVGTQTCWLEYFAEAVTTQLGRALEDITKEKSRIEVPASTFKLNDRQKDILTLLENPESSITNRQVQKLFKISQITASRDLAHLASLGLLFARGRGRSVYYTKV